MCGENFSSHTKNSKPILSDCALQQASTLWRFYNNLHLPPYPHLPTSATNQGTSAQLCELMGTFLIETTMRD